MVMEPPGAMDFGRSNFGPARISSHIIRTIVIAMNRAHGSGDQRWIKQSWEHTLDCPQVSMLFAGHETKVFILAVGQRVGI
jgi:hypothetical protein